MFKQATLYQAELPAGTTSAQISAALASAPFVECLPSQEHSFGWVPPRGEAHAPLCEAIAGQWIAKLMRETRSVPGDAIRKEVDARIAYVEANTGRKPGRKERKTIAEEARLELMPKAFSRLTADLVWINPEMGVMVVGSTNATRCDEVVACLANALSGASFRHVSTRNPVSAAMAVWLSSIEMPPKCFSILRTCELKSPDESHASVRYDNHPLDIGEVRQHIATGKLPTRLALLWNERVSFELNDKLQLKRIAFEDVVFDGTSREDKGEFDTDVAIATGELAALIADLIRNV